MGQKVILMGEGNYKTKRGGKEPEDIFSSTLSCHRIRVCRTSFAVVTGSCFLLQDSPLEIADDAIVINVFAKFRFVTRCYELFCH